MSSLSNRFGTLLFTSALAVPGFAQQATSPPPASGAEETAQPATPAGEELDQGTSGDEFEEEEIVVVGSRPRGSVIGDIPPENTLNPRDVRATGATDITELLDALAPQIGSARGRGGERPILLLNGQRISSFRELRDIPTEAIQRVEILPEEVALKYGYRADQRVVNFVLRERFRSTAVRAEGSAATEGGYVGGLGDVTRLMIGRDGRTSINLRAEGNNQLTEDERDIVRQTADGELTPDERAARTLIGSRTSLRAGATHSRTILGGIGASLNGEVEHGTGRSLLGLPDTIDGSAAILDPRVRDTTNDSAHLGLTLNGDKGSWRWSVTGNGDLSRNVTKTDPDEADSATGRDRTRSTTTSGDLDATANGPLFKLPAGDASITLGAGAATYHLDSSRTEAGVTDDSDLGRTQGHASANVDLPISRRNRDFDKLGNLTLNGNARIDQLSDFGSLTTVGAGLNWSPAQPVNFIVSWTREEGAPSVEQLGAPILETPDARIFDFTTGETVLTTAITGGNPDLLADRRNVWKLGVNWKPLDETDLRLRADYVHTRIDNPISNFPGPNAVLEAAFPDRFVRDEDGTLLSVDLRPVNFDESRRDTLRWGFDFSKPLRSRRPSQATIDQFRRRAQESGGPVPPAGDAPPPQAAGDARPSAEVPGGPGGPGGFGGRGFGRFGGGRQGGRVTFSLTHTLNLKDEVTIAPGVPELDYLHGDPLGSTGGRPRHEVEAQAGYFNNGLGARLSADWRSGTRVDTETGDDLRFSPLATFDLRLFANPGDVPDWTVKHPWLRGTQVRFEVKNLLDSKPKVRDSAGAVPLSYQPDLLDPLGRTVSITLRKLFLPPRSFFRREQSGSTAR